MSRKLDASMKKIDDVFGQMQAKGITLKDGKDGWGDGTVETYSGMVKALMTDINAKFGVADVTKVTPDHVQAIVKDRADNYFKGDTKEAYNTKTMLAAVKAFNVGAMKTNVFKGKEVNLGDVDKIREGLGSNFIRYSKSSSILRANPEQCEKVLSNIRSEGYNTPMRDVAYNASKVAYETGGRITAVLKLRPQDVDFKNNTITYQKDKGGLTRTVSISPQTTRALKEMCAGKKDNQMIFGVKNKDGTFKSATETRKGVEKIVKQAGSEFKTTEKVAIRGKDAHGNPRTVDVEKRFTPHSFRKGFAMNRAKDYYDKFGSKRAMDRYVAGRCKDAKVAKKLDTFRKFINKDRKTPRRLTKEEYAIFFTSVDLGHYRADVVNNFYTTMKEVLEYFGYSK